MALCRASGGWARWKAWKSGDLGLCRGGWGGPYGTRMTHPTTTPGLRIEPMSDALKLGFGPFAAPAKLSPSGVLIVFCNDKLKFGRATAKAIGPAAGLVTRAATAERFTGKSGSAIELSVPEGLSVARLVVIGAGKVSGLAQKDLLKHGGLAM